MHQKHPPAKVAVWRVSGVGVFFVGLSMSDLLIIAAPKVVKARVTMIIRMFFMFVL